MACRKPPENCLPGTGIIAPVLLITYICLPFIRVPPGPSFLNRRKENSRHVIIPTDILIHLIMKRMDINFPRTGIRLMVLCLLSLWILAGNRTLGQTLPDDALSFAFANRNHVNCGNDASLQLTGNTITLEAWIKVSAWGSTYTRAPIISKAKNTGFGGYELRCGGSGQVSFNLGMGTKWSEILSPLNSLTLNRWYHVCGTYNGSTIQLYINGNLVTSGSNSGNLANSSYNLLIGANNDYLNPASPADARYFSGDIDEVRIWSVARTQTEIQSSMYNALVPANEPNLVSYYQMETGSGTELEDKKGSNDGTLTFYTGYGPISSWVESYAMVVPVPSAASEVSGSGFTANWSAPAVGTVTSYKLDVSVSSTFSSFVTGYNNLDCGTSLSHVITGLSPVTTYYYRVRADKTSVTGTGANHFNTISVTTTRAAQTITFDALPVKLSTTPPFHLTATASSGLTVSYTSSNTAVATVNGNTVTLTGNSGTTDITASQSGNTTYFPAEDVVRELAVSCIQPSSGGTIGSTQTICQGFAPATLSGQSDPAGYSGILEYKWQSSATGAGSGFADISLANAPDYTPGTLSATTWFKRCSHVSCDAAWPPAGESNVVEITVNSPSYTSTASVAGLEATGENIKWYDASTGGNLLSPGTLLATGTHHYYASQTVGGVESTLRLDVTAVVDTTPCKPTGSGAQSFADGSKVADLRATGSAIRWYLTESGGTALPADTPLVNGTTYYGTQTVDCTESASRLAVAVTITL